MSLLTLPVELIHHCCFHVLAHNPLGPPRDFITLALVCRALNRVVSSHAFSARLFRLMFDVGAVGRRLFHPRDSDLADELHRNCKVLKIIQTADVTDSDETCIEDTLLSAYILMLSNDGKNYAQLEHAGLDFFVDKFINTRLWEGREFNQGWPSDCAMNSAALWLMWMTLTKQKLAARSRDARDQLTRLFLPYVVLPHRYASSSAPPNHFNLPIDPQNPYHQQPLLTTAGTSFPIYLKGQTLIIHYFNARLRVCSPFISVAAKLLFVAIKEVIPNRAPPHLPLAPGPGIVGETQQDYAEVNNSPGARLSTVVTWNWDTGFPNRVGGDESEIDETWEESKVWDTEWWRRLLCIHHNSKRPKYLPGDVFKLGSMRGCWHGKKYVPHGNLFRHFLVHPNAPSPHLFTETSIGLTLNRVFLDIQEHHKICECPLDSPNISESHPYVAATYTFNPQYSGITLTPFDNYLPIVPQSGRCGIVPIPTPLVFRTTVNQPEAGQNQGNEEGGDDEISDAITQSLPPPTISVIDFSMSNAWFPGHLGGVSFTKLPTIVGQDEKRDKVVCSLNYEAPDIRSVLIRPEEFECLSLGGRRRQQQQQRQPVGGGGGVGNMDSFVYETYDPDKKSMHRGLGDDSSTLLSGAGNQVFTTASTSSDDFTPNNDDPHKCQRCLQREALIRVERKKAETRSRMMLDRGLRAYGSDGGGYDWDQKGSGYDDDDMDMDEEENEEEEEEGDDEENEDEDEDKEMRDLDVSELGIDVDGVIEQAATSMEMDDDSTTTSSLGSSQFVSFGDDDREQYLDADIRMRKCYDKNRIGVECRGVADVLLSGGTGHRSAVWPQCKMYGRVRPWDGLIGILQTTGNTAENNVSNFFMFGYLIGEHNFVGEWRIAADNPLNPTWAGPFALSRKID